MDVSELLLIVSLVVGIVATVGSFMVVSIRKLVRIEAAVEDIGRLKADVSRVMEEHDELKDEISKCHVISWTKIPKGKSPANDYY